MNKLEILKSLTDAGVIAVVRADSEERAIKIVDQLVLGGIKDIELTFTVPHADQVIEKLTNKYMNKDVLIGAGTVLDAITARLAILSGAKYIVSPYFDIEIAKLSNLYQIPYIAGAMTITEMKSALEYGVDIIKLFPGSEASPDMVKVIKGPLPQVNIMPTGGVNLDNMHKWFEAGVVAVGVGGDLLKPADNDDWEGLTRNAHDYMERYMSIKNNFK